MSDDPFVQVDMYIFTFLFRIVVPGVEFDLDELMVGLMILKEPSRV